MQSVLDRFIQPGHPPTVATVATVATVEDAPGLSREDRALAVAFLDHVGEDDPAMRAEYLLNLSDHPRLIAGMRELARRAGIQEPNL